MGRPLKIAKSQFIGTITNTTTGTNVVTFIPAITSTVNFTVGMPIVVSTTVSNIIAGTTYWVLTIPSTTTMTLSSTPLNANIYRTPLALGTVGPVVVPFTVGLIAYGFNNPDGTANTYGVVGGNTGSYGKQVLATVALGQAGAGTLSITLGSAAVFGVGTTFTSSAPIGSALETESGALGFVSALAAPVAVTATTTLGSVVTTADNTGFVLNKPIVFSGALGGLVAGTVYYVKSKDIGGFDITVSSVAGGVVFPVTTDAGAITALQDTITLVAPATYTKTTDTWVHSLYESGYIVRQKGRSKFLVKGLTSGLVGPCFTANLADAALTANTMSISATTSAPATVLLERVSDYNVRGFGNTDTATAYYASFNAAIAANATPSQPYGVITVNNS